MTIVVDLDLGDLDWQECELSGDFTIDGSGQRVVENFKCELLVPDPTTAKPDQYFRWNVTDLIRDQVRDDLITLMFEERNREVS